MTCLAALDEADLNQWLSEVAASLRVGPHAGCHHEDDFEHGFGLPLPTGF